MINQRTVKNMNYLTLTEIKAAAGRDGEVCACIETNTIYKYLTSGFEYTADDKFILTTGNGGNTRWIGISGKYQLENYVLDTSKNLYKAVMTQTTTELTKITESISYGGTIYAILSDDTYLYIVGQTTQKVYKLLKTDLSKVTESASYGGTIVGVTSDSTYLYIGGATTQKVYKLLKTDLSKIAESDSYGGDIYAILSDDTYLYIGGVTTQKVYKLEALSKYILNYYEKI